MVIILTDFDDTRIFEQVLPDFCIIVSLVFSFSSLAICLHLVLSLSLSHDLFLPYPLFSQDQVNQYLSNQLIIQDGVGSSVEDLNQAHKRQRR